MQIARLAAHVRGHVGGEGDNVVLDLLLDFKNSLNFKFPLAADGARRAARNQPGLRLRFRRGDLDIQPLAEFIFVSPDAAHFRARVTCDHVLSADYTDFTDLEKTKRRYCKDSVPKFKSKPTSCLVAFK